MATASETAIGSTMTNLRCTYCGAEYDADTLQTLCPNDGRVLAPQYDLARAANPTPRTRRSAPKRPLLSPSLHRVLDGMTDVAAIVRNGRMELLAASTLGRALYSPAYDDSGRPPNLAWFAFMNPAARAFYPDWNGAANVAVALLRTEAGRNPQDPGLTALVGELSTSSVEFRTRWAAHNVRTHYSGTKTFHHPAVGDLTLAYDVMDLPGEAGLSLTAYTAEPASPSADALKLLASWAASLDDTDSVTRSDKTTT